MFYDARVRYERRLAAVSDHRQAPTLAAAYVDQLRPCYEWEGLHDRPGREAVFATEYLTAHPRRADPSANAQAWIFSDRLETGSQNCESAQHMDKTIRRYTSYKEMKADEYRYWQSRPAHERMNAVSELTTAAYSLKGTAQDVPRLQGPLVRLPRPKR